MSLSSGLAVAALVLSLGVGVTLYQRNQELEQRLAAVEGLRVSLGEDARAASETAPGLSGGGLARDVAELQALSDGLARRLETVERAPPSKAAVPVGEQAAALAASATFTDAVRDVVLEMATNDVDFRARIGTRDRTEIPKNAPFSRVADALQLDASQEDRLGKDLQAMQQELFTLLQEERDDGVNPLEVIAKAESLKEGDPKKGELFIQLFTMKIPGAEETYMQRAVKLQTEFRKKTLTYLRPEQNELWDAMKVDWFSIKFN